MKDKTKEITKKSYRYFSKKQTNKPVEPVERILSILKLDNVLDIFKFLDRKSIFLLMSTCKSLSSTNELIQIRNSKPFLGKQIPVKTGVEHTFFITKKDEMWGCGLNNENRLGSSDKVIKKIKYDTSFLQKGDHIKEIATGYNHTLLLSVNGQMFSCGSNPVGQNYKKFTKCNTPFLLPEETISSIAAGSGFNLILTSQGRLLGRGYYELIDPVEPGAYILHVSERYHQVQFKQLNIPCLLKNERITSIDARNGKIALYTDKKRVLLNELSWNNVHGYQNITLPLEDMDYITQVALSGLNVLVLTKNNQVYVKGYNEFGQLGLSHKKSVEEFQLCNITCLEKNDTVSRIESGYHHSLLLTSKGKLLVCGRNEKGQLGLSHNNDIYSFEECKPACLEDKEVVVAMDAGESHSVVYTSMKHYLSCGENANYQLGIFKNGKSLQSQFMPCGPDLNIRPKG